MMKKVMALTLACLALVCLTACGASTQIDTPAAEPVLQDIKTAIADELGVVPKDMNLTLIAAQRGFPEEGVAESACFTAPGEVFDDEIYMLKATDTANADIIAEKLQARLDELKKQTQNYSPESAAVLEGCEVLRNGNYVALFFSSGREPMEYIYNRYF